MKPLRILVVEDERLMRRNLVTILKMEHFDVLDAEDGTRGLAAAREHRPDLIFCDITMPGLDGHGVVRELRADPQTSDIPLVFLTARGNAPTVSGCSRQRYWPPGCGPTAQAWA